MRTHWLCLKLNARKLGIAVATLIVSSNALADTDPVAGLAILSQSSYFINSNNNGYAVHSNWEENARLMQQSSVFDRIVTQIEAVVCGSDTNRSVLIVGEPTSTWRYLFARLAVKEANKNCRQTAHAEVDISKIEAGHTSVGQVEEYWSNQVLKPVDHKNAVLYFSNLNQLIGLGSHSHDDTGIEAEYANNISSGRMRSVAFLNSYEYQHYIRSPHAYVLNAFGATVKIDNLEPMEVNQFQQDYLRVLAPGFTLVPKEQFFLNRTANFYLPNVLEPQRSINVIRKLIQKHSGSNSSNLVRQDVPRTDLETEHPYKDNVVWERNISYPDATKIQLRFESFDTETSYDKLIVSDAVTGDNYVTYSGNKGAFESLVFSSNNLNLKFTSDDGDAAYGFKISHIGLLKQAVVLPITFEREEIRRTVMEIAQAPTWLIERNFDAVKNLKANLDEDVVGCQEAKSDAVRLAKIGYVGGRTDHKPVAAQMFVGSTGTGKSYMAKQMAVFLGIKLITFDMTAYRTPESFDRFLDTLAESLVLYPFAIYLFEEIDKADSKILDRLYFMTDEGVLYDKYQRPLFARGAYIIITTNAAEDVILANPHAPDLHETVDAELRKVFRPSFLNRLDAVSIFKPFTELEYQHLAKIMVNKKIAAVQSLFDWNLTVDESSVQYIGKYGQSARYGARPMERLLDSVVTAGVAEYQLEYGAIQTGSAIAITKRQPLHEFLISSSEHQISYVVDTRNNGGSLVEHLDVGSSIESSVFQSKILKALKSNAIWSDRD